MRVLRTTGPMRVGLRIVGVSGLLLYLAICQAGCRQGPQALAREKRARCEQAVARAGAGHGRAERAARIEACVAEATGAAEGTASAKSLGARRKAQ